MSDNRQAVNPGPRRCPTCGHFMAYTRANGFWCDYCVDEGGDPPMSEQAGTWRPMRRGLHDTVVALIAEQRAAGLTPLPVHMMLVNDGPPERGRAACDPFGAWGEWVTGDAAQVTCKPCLEVVHA